MDAVMTTIDVGSIRSPIKAEHLAWAEERLGPKPGKWDGYDEIADDSARRELWSKVGYIHGLSAEAGRNIVSIGQTLCEMKEMLPHGQFMACVKAEFGWSRQWAASLMDVAEHFSNVNSSCHLPSSAKVLALLAAADADDATVQQAADERWTVKETKRRLGGKRSAGQPRQPQPTEALALNMLRKGETDRIREALALADLARTVTADQVMAELRLRDLGKQRYFAGTDADFHRKKDGSWIRLPHAKGDQPAAASEPELLPVDSEWETVSIAEAAQRMGIGKSHQLSCALSPSAIAKRGLPARNGWQAERSDERGKCRIRKTT